MRLFHDAIYVFSLNEFKEKWREDIIVNTSKAWENKEFSGVLRKTFLVIEKKVVTGHVYLVNIGVYTGKLSSLR